MTVETKQVSDLNVNLNLRSDKQLKNNILSKYIKYRYLFIMLMPVIAFFIIFNYLPMYGVIIAFKNYYPIKGIMGSKWVGLKNFEDLFTGLYFIPVLKNTLIISTYKLIFGFPAPIILCLLINEVRSKWFKKSVQTITYLPHFISWVILSGILIELLSPSRGPINYILMQLGHEPIYFVTETKWFRFVLVSSGIWREVGWGTIIYLAAVAGIDPEMYDVAELDGAGRLKRIRYITLPSMMPVITIMIIFSAGSIINDDFEQIFNLLNSRVTSVGDVISTYTYREGLVNMNYSYSAAVGLFKNIVSFSLVILANYVAKKTNEHTIW